MRLYEAPAGSLQNVKRMGASTADGESLGGGGKYFTAWVHTSTGLELSHISERDWVVCHFCLSQAVADSSIRSNETE